MDTIKTQTVNSDEIEISDRRNFLKKLAYGSLITLMGTDIASAKVRSIIQPHHYGHGRLYPHHKESHKRVIHSTSKRVRHSVSNRQALHRSKQILPAKSLHLVHTQTGDKLKLTYFEKGQYIQGALKEINHLLRDYHTNEICPIDTALLDQLFDLNQRLEINKPIQVVSAYRAPITNATLRKNSSGVAEHSFHIQGRAIDIRVEGLQARYIKEAALSLARGGVGFYPDSNFVHLDTGDVRSW